MTLYDDHKPSLFRRREGRSSPAGPGPLHPPRAYESYRKRGEIPPESDRYWNFRTFATPFINVSFYQRCHPRQALLDHGPVGPPSRLAPDALSPRTLEAAN